MSSGVEIRISLFRGFGGEFRSGFGVVCMIVLPLTTAALKVGRKCISKMKIIILKKKRNSKKKSAVVSY